MSREAFSKFKKNQKVRSTVDFPGIPAGTDGIILMVTGLEWQRYHVEFTNGRARGQISEGQLEAV